MDKKEQRIWKDLREGENMSKTYANVKIAFNNKKYNNNFKK